MKNFTSFTHSPHQFFFPKILKVPPLSQHQKNFKSLPTSRNKNFEKFYKFSKRIPKKGHACIVMGGGQVPPLQTRHFHYYSYPRAIYGSIHAIQNFPCMILPWLPSFLYKLFSRFCDSMEGRV